MPTRIFPTSSAVQPTLDELLADVRARIAPTLLRTQVPEEEDQAMVTGLDAMLKPYRASLGTSPYSSSYGAFGGANQGGYFGGGGSAIPPSSGGGYSSGGGGYSGGTSGGSPVPYSGPPDPTVEQWQSAYPTTGLVPNQEMRRVPMNTGSLVERYENAGPNQDVRGKLGGNVDRDFLMPEAAQSWRAMMRDAAADGVPLVFGESYRSLEEQKAAAASRGIYGQGGWAAVPGTSQHGLGLAIDLDLGASPQQRDWLIQNGPKYGWHFPMSDEPWHIQYEGGYEGWSPGWSPDWTPSPNPIPPIGSQGGGFTPEAISRIGRLSGGASPVAPAPQGTGGAGSPRRKPSPSPRPSRTGTSRRRRVAREGLGY